MQTLFPAGEITATMKKAPTLLKCICFGLATFVNWPSQAKADGIAAIKEQDFHSDSAAQVIVYSRIIAPPGPYVKIVTSQKTVNLQRSKFAGNVDVMTQIPSFIESDQDIAPIRLSLEQITNFSKRFTKSEPLLKPHIAALQFHIQKFEDNQVRHEGVWIPRMEYAKILAREAKERKQNQLIRQEEREELERKKIKEAKFASEQAKKGLAFDGKEWVPKDQINYTDSDIKLSLGDEIAPIQKPDMESAKIAVANLESLSQKQSGTEKIRTERLLKVVKNLFTAEFRLAEQYKAAGQDELKAAHHDKNAKNWLKPNAFGTVNEVASRESAMKATEILQKSRDRILERQTDLLSQLQEVDAVTHDFHKIQEYKVVLILSEAVQAISSRSLPSGAFTPTFTASALNEVRNLIKNQEQWLASAKNAEASENFEEAMRYYSMAKDLRGRKRCALRMAQNLETRNLIGSAIDYYQIAGDFKKAAELRQKNPQLLTDSFTTLKPEDLFAKVAPSCVRVVQDGGHGTGFFFRRGGYILTNKHVIDGKGGIQVKFDDERVFDAEIVEKSPDLDLAIIKIPHDEHDQINFRLGEEVKIGTPVTLIGYPQKDLPPATMNTGHISNADRSFDGNPVYQLDVSANHGNSGGPVVDQAGRLVGILTFGLGDLKIDRFNFAITVEALDSFVKKAMND
jgi:hypothetical protein